MNLTGHAVTAFAVVTMLGACSGNAAQPSYLPPATAQQSHSKARGVGPHTASGYVYVSNITQQGVAQLLVYPAGTSNPSPIRTVTTGLVNALGVAVDPSGNVYVANGSAGNVLEFGPGGSPLIQTYSTDLVHPAAVAVANGTLYVSDQGNAANGYLQQILEFPLGNGTPSMGVAGIGGLAQRNVGIAVDPTGASGTFFTAASSLSAVPPSGACPAGNSYTFGENLFPTLWQNVPLTRNQQAWGVAFDATGKLYVSDICANKVITYTLQNYQWTYADTVSGTYDAPLFLTIYNQMLAVPNALANSKNPANVTVIDLSGSTSTVTITSGLHTPVGAAVGSGS